MRRIISVSNNTSKGRKEGTHSFTKIANTIQYDACDLGKMLFFPTKMPESAWQNCQEEN